MKTTSKWRKTMDRFPATLGLIFAMSGVAYAAPPPLTLQIGPTSVTASGATGRGQVVFFSVAREIHHDWNAIVPRQAIQTESDSAGNVVFDVGQPVPLQSIWVAVDLTTGRTAVKTPDGFPLRLSKFQQDPVRHGNGGDDRIRYGRPYGHVLLVRPGVGAWTAIAADGGAEDADGKLDGITTIDPARMTAVGYSQKPPQRFSPHDIVVGIDPFRLEIFSTDVQ